MNTAPLTGGPMEKMWIRALNTFTSSREAPSGSRTILLKDVSSVNAELEWNNWTRARGNRIFNDKIIWAFRVVFDHWTHYIFRSDALEFPIKSYYIYVPRWNPQSEICAAIACKPSDNPITKIYEILMPRIEYWTVTHSMWLRSANSAATNRCSTRKILAHQILSR